MSYLRTFRLFERELCPGCREIKVEGELDLAVAEQLQATLRRARGECAQILVCLEGCEFIDSTGIAMIVQAHNEFAEHGGRVVVYGPSDQVLRVLSLTGLTANGLVFDTLEDALSALDLSTAEETSPH
ncbi:MAG: STAS domain-containing protein [Solirubrobacterales bacterium]